jgi:hypothetical protein
MPLPNSLHLHDLGSLHELYRTHIDSPSYTVPYRTHIAYRCSRMTTAKAAVVGTNKSRMQIANIPRLGRPRLGLIVLSPITDMGWNSGRKEENIDDNPNPLYPHRHTTVDDIARCSYGMST